VSHASSISLSAAVASVNVDSRNLVHLSVSLVLLIVSCAAAVSASKAIVRLAVVASHVSALIRSTTSGILLVVLSAVGDIRRSVRHASPAIWIASTIVVVSVSVATPKSELVASHASKRT